MNSPGLASAVGRRLALAVLIVGLTAVQAVADGAVYPGLIPDAFMKGWLVLGPIPAGNAGTPDEAAQKAAFASDLLAAAGGEASATPKAGAKATVAGKDYEWRLVLSPADTIGLDAALARAEFSVAYAAAELTMPEATKGLLGIGSDDGIRIWLNGTLVHDRWIGRAVQPDADVVPVEFQKGANRLLLKIQNMQGPWGFACRLLGKEGQAKGLTAAARGGDTDEIKRLLQYGVDVNGRDQRGLTAAQTARLYGRKEIVELLASQGADTKTALPPPEKLVDALFASVIKSDTPGASVLVAKDGKIMLERAYGLANVEERVPVTAATRFRIGSITKQFTAAAILKLQEDGKLRVTDTLAKYIPDYPRGGEVTIHHLLTHTSGIHSYTSKPDFIQTVTSATTPDELIKSFKDDPYDFEPGQKWLYNNSGYFLLGYIIEKVSGQSYGSYLSKTFFEPLGMKDTGVYDAGVKLEREALGYSAEEGKAKKANDWNMSRAGAAGALYSTVGDLYRWDEAVFSGKVLKDASRKAAFTPVVVAEDDKTKPKETGYGYGWSIQEVRHVKEIAHGGGLQGFLSYLMRLPDQRFTVAVLSNCAPPLPGVDPGGLSREIAELYLGDALPPREAPKVAAVEAKAREAIVGRYDYGNAIMTVTTEGDKVFAQLSGQPRFEIFPKSDTTFFWKVVEAEVTFEKNDQGVVTTAVHKQGGQTIRAAKLEDVQTAKVDPKVYDAYVGRYSYGPAVMTVTREGDRLFAELTGQPKVEIFPKSETEFFWKVVNAQVTFVKDASGKTTKAVHQQGGRTFDAPRLP